MSTRFLALVLLALLAACKPHPGPNPGPNPGPDPAPEPPQDVPKPQTPAS